MKVRIIEPVQTKTRILPVGLVIEIAEHTLPKLAGKVRVLYHSGANGADRDDSEHEGMPDYAQTVCQARKVGGRTCGALLREGINGHLSCSNPACQAPATPHGLTPRTTKYLNRH